MCLLKSESPHYNSQSHTSYASIQATITKRCLGEKEGCEYHEGRDEYHAFNMIFILVVNALIKTEMALSEQFLVVKSFINRFYTLFKGMIP